MTVHATYHALAATTTHAASTGSGWLGWLLLFGAGVLVGRLWGRRAGLRHLGEAEFRTRWANINRIRRW